MSDLEQMIEKLVEPVADRVARRVYSEAPPRAVAFDEETTKLIREQALIAHKTYLTHREAAIYLNVSERSIGEWSARAHNQNPFPQEHAGGDPRYKRSRIDEWTVAEGQRQRLKLAG
jgi:hypothetical protein